MFDKLTNTDAFGALAFAAFWLGMTVYLLWDEGWYLACCLFN